MLPDKCALVITSSVYVSAPYTQLRDPEQRKNQYMDSIAFFIQKSPLTRIIVCDNSGFVYPESLTALAASCKKEIELLSFTGDRESVEQYGKGYGEGEILRYVLSQSRLIQKAEGFWKVTGRLKVDNMTELFRRSHHTENYFMPITLLRPGFMTPKTARRCVNVAVYYTTKTFFTDTLLNAYTSVSDEKICFLEHAYYEALTSSAASVKCFAIAPEVSGISGSNGWTLKHNSRLKNLMIRAGVRLGYIRPV